MITRRTKKKTSQETIKENEKNLYSEKIINLPKIWNCHSGIDSDLEVESLPCLKNEDTFGL